jgi:DNA-binding transcriptional MerR regulator
MMLVGELAQRTNLSRDTIRFYEKLQLIKPLIRSNGYKDYTEQNLQQLKLIQSAKKLGFTLTEIKQRYPIAYKSNYIPSLLRLSPV